MAPLPVVARFIFRQLNQVLYAPSKEKKKPMRDISSFPPEQLTRGRNFLESTLSAHSSSGFAGSSVAGFHRHVEKAQLLPAIETGIKLQDIAWAHLFAYRIFMSLLYLQAAERFAAAQNQDVQLLAEDAQQRARFELHEAVSVAERAQEFVTVFQAQVSDLMDALAELVPRQPGEQQALPEGGTLLTKRDCLDAYAYYVVKASQINEQFGVEMLATLFPEAPGR